MTPVCPEPSTSAYQAIRICRSEWVARRESAGYQASRWTFCPRPGGGAIQGTVLCPVAADGGAEPFCLQQSAYAVIAVLGSLLTGEAAQPRDREHLVCCARCLLAWRRPDRDRGETWLAGVGQPPRRRQGSDPGLPGTICRAGGGSAAMAAGSARFWAGPRRGSYRATSWWRRSQDCAGCVDRSARAGRGVGMSGLMNRGVQA